MPINMTCKSQTSCSSSKLGSSAKHVDAGICVLPSGGRHKAKQTTRSRPLGNRIQGPAGHS